MSDTPDQSQSQSQTPLPDLAALKHRAANFSETLALIEALEWCVQVIEETGAMDHAVDSGLVFHAIRASLGGKTDGP